MNPFALVSKDEALVMKLRGTKRGKTTLFKLNFLELQKKIYNFDKSLTEIRNVWMDRLGRKRRDLKIMREKKRNDRNGSGYNFVWVLVRLRKEKNAL